MLPSGVDAGSDFDALGATGCSLLTGLGISVVAGDDEGTDNTRTFFSGGCSSLAPAGGADGPGNPVGLVPGPGNPVTTALPGLGRCAGLASCTGLRMYPGFTTCTGLKMCPGLTICPGLPRTTGLGRS